jgi:hypothetical protein
VSRPHPWLHAFLDVPAEHAETAARFWAAASGAEIGAPWPEHPEFRSLDPATGSRYLHVQRHSGPPRLHLDLTTPQVDAEAARLVALGAVAQTRFRWWQVLRSPGGLPFCLVEETPVRSRPEPVCWPGGHRSRVARLVVDAPADRYDAECAFWAAATGWSESTNGRPEIRSLRPPDSSRCSCCCTGSTSGTPRCAPTWTSTPTTSTRRCAGWSRWVLRSPPSTTARG